MNIKANLLGENMNFVDNTKKQKKYFKIIMFLFAIIISAFFLYLLFNFLNE